MHSETVWDTAREDNTASRQCQSARRVRGGREDIGLLGEAGCRIECILSAVARNSPPFWTALEECREAAAPALADAFLGPPYCGRPLLTKLELRIALLTFGPRNVNSEVN